METVCSPIPNAGETLLLRGLLLPGPEAEAAARQWLEQTGIEGLNEGLLRLLPLLRHRLDPALVPERARPGLARVVRHYWLANTRWQYQAGQILAGLPAPVVALKGLALAHSVYPTSLCRPCNDLDLLVAPEAFEAVRDHLLGFGYTADGESLHAQLLTRPGWPEVDLHRSPYHEACSAALVRPILERVVPLSVHDVAIQRLGDADQLLHTLAHGLRPNRVSPLRWVVDADRQLTAAGSALDWSVFLAESSRLGLSEVAARSLAVLEDLVPGRVPVPILQALEQQRSPASARSFRLEREIEGPLNLWFRMRRNAPWPQRLLMLVQRYRQRWRSEGSRDMLGRGWYWGKRYLRGRFQSPKA
mgnify:CR=1 FL=1